MNIAIKDIYGSTYINDKCFKPEACKIGENLLLPGIMLKKSLEEFGHNYHTLDLYEIKNVDIVVFQDVPQSLLTIESFREGIGYLVRGRWKDDALLKIVRSVPKERRILVIMEPPIVWKKSYNRRFHDYFGKILTWNDQLVDGERYKKYYFPQVVPFDLECRSLEKRRLITMVCGNKKSREEGELYSERRKVIDYFENKEAEFDLYGFGWESEGLRNYKGIVEKKLETLANYKFCVCYENMTGVSGYVTEKIFDCFFAGCIPIYWGATNIKDLIPEKTFIDMTEFSSIRDMHHFITSLSDDECQEYVNKAKEYINSEFFRNTFEMESYVNVLRSEFMKAGGVSW